MTIKILKQGKSPKDIEYLFKCYHCKTEFTACISDGEKVLSRDPREPDYVTVACPICNSPTQSVTVV